MSELGSSAPAGASEFKWQRLQLCVCVYGGVHVCRIKQQLLWLSVSAAHQLNLQPAWKWLRVSESSSSCRCGFLSFNWTDGADAAVDADRFDEMTHNHELFPVFALSKPLNKRGWPWWQPHHQRSSSSTRAAEAPAHWWAAFCVKGSPSHLTLTHLGWWMKGCPTLEGRMRIRIRMSLASDDESVLLQPNEVWSSCFWTWVLTSKCFWSDWLNWSGLL